MTGIVPMILPFHILAGVLALVFGYVALYAAKGAALHRKSGLLFVFAMVTLSLTGALVAFLSASSISVVAGLLTFYFVTTALLTRGPPSAARRSWPTGSRRSRWPSRGRHRRAGGARTAACSRGRIADRGSPSWRSEG